MDLNLLKEKLEMEELHLAREALVITISEISRKDITPRPILVLPICDHKNESLILEIIPEIIKQFNVHNKDASLVNLASDGDSNRRKALNKLRKKNNSLPIIEDLKLFDQMFLIGELGIDYDIKHIIKRLRSSIISETNEIILIKKTVNKCHLRKLLAGEEINHLLDPKDKQNVPAAVKLFTLIAEKINMCETEHLTVFEKDEYNEFQLLSLISNLLLSVFVLPTINLLDQLTSLALLAHLLLYIYRKHKTNFMTNDLYSDIQSTIQSVFITVAKFQSKNSDQSLYLYQLGTDQLEGFFSTIRTLTHSKNCNFLELKQRMVVALQIEKVYIDNPMWRNSSRVSATTNDHSSAASWTGNLQTNTEEWSLKTIWHYSNSRAKNLLTDYGYSQTELTISDNSITMLQPFGSILEIIDTQPSILSLKTSVPHKTPVVFVAMLVVLYL
jgi:hypothetical protein